LSGARNPAERKTDTMTSTTIASVSCKLCARNAGGTKCKRHHKAHMAALRAEADRVISTGKCPCCGTGLVRNPALTGWYQCGGYASEGFRHKGFESAPKCSYQVFGS
jgi:hypothetical protein